MKNDPFCVGDLVQAKILADFTILKVSGINLGETKSVFNRDLYQSVFDIYIFDLCEIYQVNFDNLEKLC